MATLGWFMEFDPSQDKGPLPTNVKPTNQGITTRPVREPYYTHAVDLQFPRARLAGVAYERRTGLEYQCVKMQTGLQNKCDAAIWMAPGRPQDQGTINNGQRSGVWLQQKQASHKFAVAGSAPYQGIYTGLKGYIQSITENE